MFLIVSLKSIQLFDVPLISENIKVVKQRLPLSLSVF